MPTPIPTDFTLGAVAPEEAMAAFQARNLLETTFSWQDLWHVEHTRAFTISRLAETDLLDFVRAELDKAIEAGTDFRDWADTIQQRFEAAGWWGKRQVIDTATGEKVSTTFDPKRLQLIFEVNTRQSYAAGRWAGIERGMRVLDAGAGKGALAIAAANVGAEVTAVEIDPKLAAELDAKRAIRQGTELAARI